jgi:hypothetical protein
MVRRRIEPVLMRWLNDQSVGELKSEELAIL